MKKVYIYSFIVWILLVFAAIFNAGIREALFTPNFGEHVGHVLSTITFIIIIYIVTYLLFNKIKMEYTEKDLIIVGASWMVLTILFEFGFGHFIMGHSWGKLFADYNLLKGRVWVLIPLVSLIFPWLNGYYLKSKNNAQ